MSSKGVPGTCPWPQETETSRTKCRCSIEIGLLARSRSIKYSVPSYNIKEMVCDDNAILWISKLCSCVPVR